MDNLRQLWSRSRRLRIVTRIVAALFLLTGIGIAGVNIYLNRLASNRLKEAVHASTDGLYTLKYDRVRVNALTGALTVFNAELIPNTTVFRKMQQEGRSPRFLVGGKVDRLVARNVRSLAYLFSRELKVGRIIIDNPRFSLFQYRLEKDTAQNASGVYQVLAKRLNDLRIGSFNIRNAIIHYQVIDTASTKRTINKVEHLDIGFSNVHFAGKDSARHLAAEEYSISLKEYRHRTSDSLYWIGAHGFQYNSRSRKLGLDSFRVDPVHPEKAFARRLGYQASVYRIALNSLSAENFDLSHFAETGTAAIGELNIAGGSVGIYMDRSIAGPARDKRNVVISQKLKTLGLPFNIGNLLIRSLDLSYREFNPVTEQTATIRFSKLSCKASNVTNIPAQVRRNNEMKVLANALFMGAEMRADFVFDLNSPQGAFTSNVNVNQIEAARLNEILVPIARIEARKGLLRQLKAAVRGNENAASANVHLTYEDLKINLLKEDGDSLKKAGFKTMFANMLIPDENPKNGVLRTASQVTVRRRLGRSFFSMVWAVLSAGIQEIILGKKATAFQSQ